MTVNKNAIATDLKRLDAHVVQPAEYADAPELTDAQLAAANVHEAGKLVRRGRPPSASRKQPVKLRLDPSVLEFYRALGPGWQTQINDTLAHFVTLLLRKQSGIDPMLEFFRTLRKAVKAKNKALLHRAPRHRPVKTRRSANRSLHAD